MKRPILVAMDLEGVLIPEIWISVAEKTGIEKLRLTTRDIPDYGVLMRGRIQILKDNGLKLRDIQDVIDTMQPYDGALEYLNWLRENSYQAVILSDTFYQFAAPFMRKLGWPTLFCNNLVVDSDNNVTDYQMRILDGKRHAVLSFKNLNFDVVAMGDSYNDVSMLKEADLGMLFRPSPKVVKENPQLPVVSEYAQIKEYITKHAAEN